MSEMVERVARVILKTQSPEADFDYCKSVADHPLYRNSMASARDAIAAMREPTEAMAAAGSNFVAYGDHGSVDVWRSMIEAALR